MLPLLKFAEDNKEHSLREVIEYLVKYFNLTDEERKELLPSGEAINYAESIENKIVLIDGEQLANFIIDY
jgi:restriction endonuclease Mrr